MIYDKRYLIFIAFAILFSSIACYTTLLIFQSLEHIGLVPYDCSPVTNRLFNIIGRIPTMLLGECGMALIMFIIPFILGQQQKLSLVSCILLSAFVIFTFLDAVNDVSALYGFNQPYQVAHAAMEPILNVSGSATGSGNSLC